MTSSTSSGSTVDLSNLYNIVFGHLQNAQPSTNTLFRQAGLSNGAVVPAASTSTSGMNAQIIQIQALLPQLATLQGNLIPSQLTALIAALQALLKEVMKLSTRVGTFPDDDERLARALYESEGKAQTYRQALDALDKVNDHSAAQWKDYYLDHGNRIHKLMNKLGPQSPPALSNRMPQLVLPPSMVGSSDSQASISPRAEARKTHNDVRIYPPIPRASQMVTSGSAPRPPVPMPPLSSSNPYLGIRARQTHQSSSSHSLQYEPLYSQEMPLHLMERTSRRHGGNLANLHLNSVEIKVPPRPQRSPTPPTHVEKSARGYRFTEEDQKFFVDLILWEVGRDPTMTRQELCKILSSKAPHHSAEAWTSHWARKSDVANKAYRTAEAIGKRVRKKAMHGHAISGVSPDKTSGDVYDSGPDAAQGDGSEPDTSDWDPDPPTDEDIRKMGTSHKRWAISDKRVLARHIAMQDDWESLTRGHKFGSFFMKYNLRSADACAQLYDKNKEEMDRMARQYHRYRSSKKKAATKKPFPIVRVKEVISLLSEDEDEERIIVAMGKRKSAEDRSLPQENDETQKRQKVAESM